MMLAKSVGILLAFLGASATFHTLRADETVPQHAKATAAQRPRVAETQSAPANDPPFGLSLATETKNNSMPGPPSLVPTDFSVSHVAGRVMAVMGLLISICLGAMWYGHRNQALHRKKDGSAGSMQIVDTLALAPRCCVHLIQVDGQRFLLSRDHSGVKSMVPVGSFSATLDDLDRTPEPTEHASVPGLLDEGWKHRNYPWTWKANE